MPFRDVHLTTDRYGGMRPPGSWTMVYGFAVIGVLILLVACFNFTNLATARAMMRAREITLAQVVGASRGQLVVQFLGESVLMALDLAGAGACSGRSAAARPSTASWDSPSRFTILSDWPLTWRSLAIARRGRPDQRHLSRPGAVGLSARRRALRTNSAANQAARAWLRTMLVVLQFAVSIGLGIAALVVFAQISFARSIDLGFNKDKIVVIDTNAVTPRPSKASCGRWPPTRRSRAPHCPADVPFSGNSSNDAGAAAGRTAATA